MKHLRIKIYTTSRGSYLREGLDEARQYLTQTKGIDDVAFDVEVISPPTNIMTIGYYKNNKYYVRPVWDWFREKFHTDDTYDAIGWHFTPYYRKKWDLTESVNGMYYRNADDNTLDFWLCTYSGKAARYDFSEVCRLVLHELGGHGYSHWTGAEDNTHFFDYELNAIQRYPSTLSFHDWNIYKKIVTILKDFLWKHSN